MKYLVAFLAVLSLGQVAHAQPDLNNNDGFFYDDYGTSFGLNTALTVGAVRINQSTAMSLSAAWTPPPACCADTSCTEGENCVPPPAVTGHFTTIDVEPSSFSAWRSIFIEHSELVQGQVTVFFEGIDSNGDITVFGPLARNAATPGESPYTLRFSLDGVSATTFKKGRVRVEFSSATAVNPRVLTLKLTWTPVPSVRLVIEAPTTVCSQATLTLRTQVAVSYTDVRDFLVTIAVPTGVAPAQLPQISPGPFAQNALTGVAQVADGGFYHAGPGPLTVAPGVVVQPGHVYWYRELQRAGTSFVLSSSFSIPQGLLNQTTYDVQAQVSGSNMAAPTLSNAPRVTVGTTNPAPAVFRNYSGIYRINGVDYSYPSREITINLSGYNHNNSPACAETYYQAYVWDDLTPLIGKIVTPGGTLASGITGITAGGLVSGPTGVTTWDGFAIPANVVYWDLRTLNVNSSFARSYKFLLQAYTGDGGSLVADEVLNQCAKIASDFRSNTYQNCRGLTIGVPDRPDGMFALGDRIRGAIGVGAGYQDNNTSTVEFGERYSLAMYATNRGVSALNNVVMFNKIPAEVTVDSVYTPPSANAIVRYYLGTDYTDPTVPPPLDVDGNPPANDPNWVSVLPANRKSVQWVYVQVPWLSSTFFSGILTHPGVPSNATAEISVTVDQPDGACAEFLVEDRMVGRVYGYANPEMVFTGVPTGGLPRVLPNGATHTPGSAVDYEWASVRPRTPRANVSMWLSPSTIVGSGNITVSAYLSNQQPGGSPTGAMQSPSLVLTLPKLSINGGPINPLAYAGGLSTPGSSSVDLSEIATTGRITVTYPTLGAGESRSVSLRLFVPKGFRSGDAMSATVVGSGADLYCGPTAASASASAGVRAEPSLYLTKTVDFGVAGPGSELNYELTLANTGQAVATGAWIVDRLPNAVSLAQLKIPSWVKGVWFSAAAPPVLPELISNEFLFNSSVVQSNFQQGTYSAPDANGLRTVTWPAGMTPRWIAWDMVDPALSPPILVTDVARVLRFKVNVLAGVPENTIANNDELALADGLLQTVGLRAVTIISPAPSLRLAVQCGSAVLAGGEQTELSLPYYNDSANDDTAVTVDLDLGELEFVSFTHVWNAFSVGLRGTPAITHEDLGMGQHRFTIISPPDEPLGSLEGGTLLVRYRPGASAQSGDILPTTIVGTAINASGEFASVGQCQTLVSNPDIQVQKTIDQIDPPSGQTVTFTLFLKNAGAHWAPSVVLTDIIPPEFIYTPGSVQILSPGWTGTPNYNGATKTLTWSNLRSSSASIPTRTPAIPADGFIPGGAEVIIQFQAKVANIGPDRPLQNCASATTTLVEDDPDPLPVGETSDNVGCATARTPLPDMWVSKSVQSSALPGDRVTFTLQYRNLSRESAVGAYIVDRLPLLPSDLYPTAAAVTYSGFHGNNGEVAYFSAAPRNAAQPAFNPTAPTTGGWSATPTTPVNWVAFKLISPIGPQSQTRTIELDVNLIHPVSRVLPEAGARFENCVAVAMGGTGAVADANNANNAACATVGTPGIDLALAASCDPATEAPGVRPGEPGSYTLTVRNNASTIAYGVRLTPAPGVRLLNPEVTGTTAGATNAAGQPVALRNESGDLRGTAVARTQVGDDWLLGATTGDDFYKTVGLAPQTSVSLTFAGTVSTEALSGEVVVNGGYVTPDYGIGFQPGIDEVEDNVGNNGATCDVTAWRPDLVVRKEVSNTDPADVGESLHYTLTLENLGQAAGQNVLLRDLFPAGTRLVNGSVSGATLGNLEYVDGDFNWTSAEPNSGAKGIRLNIPGDMYVGGDGEWAVDTAEELDAGVHDGTEVDASLGAVILSGGGEGGGEVLCSSGQSYTLEAGRTFTYYADFSYYGNYNFSTWPNEFEYVYPDALTACCLEPGSVPDQICQDESSDYYNGMEWEYEMAYCDGQFADNELYYWSDCVCESEWRRLGEDCVANCQMSFDSCIQMQQDSCRMDYQMAADEYDSCTMNCNGDPYCESECGYLDRPYDGCDDPENPYWQDAYGSQYYFGIYDGYCQMEWECVDQGSYESGPCYQYPSFYDDCTMSPDMYVLDAADNNPNCGAQPEYPCFEQVGPPPHDYCNTGASCGGEGGGGTTATYRTPVAPSFGALVPPYVQAWTSLTLDHDFALGALTVSLETPEGDPIAGFTNLTPDASGSVSLASLLQTFQRFVVVTNFSASAGDCMTYGNSVDMSDTGVYAEMFDMMLSGDGYMPWVRFGAGNDGTIVRAFRDADSFYGWGSNYLGNYYLHITAPSGQTQVLGSMPFNSDYDSYNDYNLNAAIDVAGDGTVVAPIVESFYSDWQGEDVGVDAVHVLVPNGAGGYSASQAPAASGSLDWAQYWFGYQGTSSFDPTGTRLAAHKDLVFGPYLDMGQDDWEACNADLVMQCADALQEAEAYYEKVQTCAQWYECLQQSYDECWSNDPDPNMNCGYEYTDSRYVGLCAGFDHDSGCTTDSAAGEFYDYEQELQGGFSTPEAYNCQGATYWGQYQGYGPDGYYDWNGSISHDFSGLALNNEQFYFGDCDYSVSMASVLASFSRVGGTWNVAILPSAGSIQSRVGSIRLIDVTPDGNRLFGMTSGRQMIEWRRVGGIWQPPVAVVAPAFTNNWNAKGEVSAAGDFVWAQFATPPAALVRGAAGWSHVAMPLSATDTVWAGNAEARVLAGFTGSGSTAVRWTPTGDTFTRATVSLSSLGISSLIPLDVGADGTVVGYGNKNRSTYSGQNSVYGRVGWVWPPDAAPYVIELEPGTSLSAANLTPEGRVIGFYAGVSDYYTSYNGNYLYPENYAAFSYGCGSSARPSLDKVSVAYEASGSLVLDFDLEVEDVCQTSVTNTGTVENDIPEVTLANNTSSVTAGINVVTLETALTASKSAVSLNDQITYTFAVTNKGPGVARDVEMTGAVPTQVTITSGTPSQSLGDIQPGQTEVWTVTGNVNTNVPNLTLTATSASATSTIQCDLQKTTSSATSLTGSWPNLKVTKTGPDSATVSTSGPATQITYNIAIASDGNDTATGVVLTDVLPSGVTYVSSSPTATSVNGDNLIWNVGNMAAGTSMSVAVTVALPGCAAQGTKLLNVASATATSIETNISDNTSSKETTLLGPLGRARVNVTLDQRRVQSGERVWYTVRYWNQGAAPVTGATVTVPMPTNAAFVAGSATGGISPAGGTLTWSVGDLSLGESGSVAFAITASGGAIASMAEASIAGGGSCASTAPIPASNAATDALVISKTANVATACAAETPRITWSITAINRGATALANVVVTDSAPNYVAGSITGVGAQASGAPSLAWNVGTLAPGRGVTLTYQTTTPAGTLNLISGAASVSATGQSPTASNNATVMVDCATQLSLAKSWTGVCTNQGTVFAVTLTARNRTGAARSVTLNDEVPASLEIVDRGGAPGSGQSIVYAAVNVPALSTVTRTFTVKTAAGVADGTPITNEATAASGDIFASSNPVVSVPITCAGPTEPECQSVACSVDGACIYPAINNGASCSDDSLCTANDKCAQGACVGSNVDCDDGRACTIDSCTALGGCQHNETALAGTSCIDGDACTIGDLCNNEGSCAPGVARDCDDGNPCTNDSCDPQVGCVNVANTAACDDGNACTDGDTCSNKVCGAGAPKVCNDTNACTDDSCNPATGCVYTNDNTNTCTDSLFCTTQERCQAGTCVSTPRACNDSNTCTTDSCSEVTRGCLFDGSASEGSGCDDGDLCTTGDICMGGQCAGDPETCGS